MRVTGRARLGRRTKELVRRLRPGEVAFVDHPDLDRVAAKALVRCRARAVVNASPSLTGRYPAEGTDLLLEAGIPVVDRVGEAVFAELADGDAVLLEWGEAERPGAPARVRVRNGVRVVAEGRAVTREILEEERRAGRRRFQREFVAFLQNTVQRADLEKATLLGDLDVPRARVPVYGRPALVVVRGPDFREDLEALAAYIRNERPVLVAVDGGADALLELGLRPDVVVGDMDSVSDEALRRARQLVVHAYPDGRAPGLRRVESLGLSADVLAAPGTSEDVALQFAYHNGARLLVLVGSHSGFVDFMEKGRAGMASTLLTRIKVGHVLVDAKGVHELYRFPLRRGVLAGVALAVLAAALVPTAVVLLSSPLGRAYLDVIYWKLRIWMGL